MSMKYGLSVGIKERLVRSLTQTSLIKRKNLNIASLLCGHQRSARKEFTIDFYGYKYTGSINNITDWRVYFNDNFIEPEMALLRHVGSLVRQQGKPFVCYDIGASSGHMTLAMASEADRVLAVEPFVGAISELRDKVRANSLSHVKAFQVGFGEERAKVKFDILSFVNLLVKRCGVDKHAAYLGMFEAVIVNGDDFIRRNRIDLPSFIRINADDDVLSILKGLSACLRQALPVLMIDLPKSTSSTVVTEKALRDLLYEDAYLFSFRRADDGRSFVLDGFSPFASRIICIPPDMMKMAGQEWCKLHDAGHAAH